MGIDTNDIRNDLKSDVERKEEPTSLSVYIQEIKNGQNFDKSDIEIMQNMSRLKIIFLNTLLFFICLSVIGIIVVGVYLLFSSQLYAPIADLANKIILTRHNISLQYGEGTLLIGDILTVFIAFIIGVVLLRITLFRKDVISFSGKN